MELALYNLYSAGPVFFTTNLSLTDLFNILFKINLRINKCIIIDY